MGFRIFSNQPSPIAIDFGSTSVKLLQIDTKEKPGILGAAELALPDEVRQDLNARISFLEQNLPATLRSAGFKGRRAACTVPASQAVIQHMQLSIPDGVKRDDAVKSQLQITMGIAPDSVVVRSHEIAEINRDGQTRTEIICLAIPRELIMRHVALLEKCRLEVAGVHSPVMSTLRAFDHTQRRDSDQDMTTMYIDLGWAGTRVIIAQGAEMTFARAIQIGGMHFDQLIAKQLKCELAEARKQRLSLPDEPVQQGHAASAGAPQESQLQASGAEGEGLARMTAAMAGDNPAAGSPPPSTNVGEVDRRSGQPAPAIAHAIKPGEGHRSMGNVDFTELLETITDELSMCLRYHRGLFPNRPIDRIVLIGGEASQNWLCRHVAKAMRLPARLGDPLARFASDEGAASVPGLDRSQPQPGWATVCGLCAAEA